MQSLIAIRSKLKRSLVLRTNVIYEVSVDQYNVHTILPTALPVLFPRKMAS
jgi:hypothetical protein